MHDLVAPLVSSYWFDSGTLLGLIRDGREIEWDSDCDIGIWDDDLDRLLSHLPRLRSQGYRTSYRRYNGRIYGVTIHFPAPGLLPVHIHVYFRHKEIAWSPQTVGFKPYERANVLEGFKRSRFWRNFLLLTRTGALERRRGNVIARSIKWGIYYPLWGAFVIARNCLDRQHWATVPPFSALYSIYTWIIPSSHFTDLETIVHEGHALSVPANPDQYLTRRYGNWKVPVADWCYWTDDSCIVPCPPEIALQNVEVDAGHDTDGGVKRLTSLHER